MAERGYEHIKPVFVSGHFEYVLFKRKYESGGFARLKDDILD